jgi:hypothetical protein
MPEKYLLVIRKEFEDQEVTLEVDCLSR